MWLAAIDPAAMWALTGTIAAAVLTLVSGLVTALFAFRGSRLATEAQREAAFDVALNTDRVTLRTERDALRTQLETAVTERDDYRERWARLRLEVISVGLDPDLLPKQRAGNAHS